MGRVFQPHTITDDSAVGGQIIQGSLIFDDDHSTFFHRDMVGGNRKVWTLSYWTKLLDVNSTSSQRFWSAGDSGSGDVLKCEYYSGSSTRQIGFIDNNHAGSGIRFTTDAHLQDNAWYHIVMAVDTTVGTAANRVKIYINGELQTLWSSGSEHNHPPNQNYDTAMNKASLGLAFGRAYAFGAGSATHFEGQMAELYLVDGQQLEPTEFGYTESQTGIWRPKKFDRKGPNNGTTWSSNTSGNVYSGSAAGVFSGNLDANGINGNGDANNNHFTVSSLNVVASKVGVRLSNASSDVEVSVNGSVVGTIAQGNIATNIASRHTFTFSERTVTSVKVRRTGSASGWFLYEIQLDDVPLINGNVSNMGQNGFYYPLDGSHHITKDLSGNGNDSVPYNLRGTVPLHMATGGLPILNTNKGGTVVCPGVRPDPLASNIVLALPLSNRSNSIGFDVHHLIKGSGSAKTLTNNSVGGNVSYFNFYGRSGNANIENASSQQIDISTSNDFSMSTGDFTVECWIYPKSTGAADGSLFVTHNGSTYFAFNFSPNTGRFNIYLNSGSAVFSPAAEEGMIEYTKWNHVALVKHSNVVKVYVNGLAIGSHNHSSAVGFLAADTTICRIGGGGSSSLNVYMQDMRVYKGVAKYTDTFTCASTDSSIIPDSPSGIAVPRKFEPSISGSVGFEGTTSYLSIPHSTDLNLTNQDFCLEAFIYPIGSGNSQFGYVFNKGFSNQISFRDNGNSGRMVAYLASAGSGSYDIVNDFSSGSGTVPLHQWSHIALIRTSGTLKWFINGVEKASTSASATVHSNTDAFTIGTYLGSPSNYEFRGSISNARITIGEAVYTSNFTPPSEPLTLTSQGVTSSNVKLLCCKDQNDETAADKIPTGSITRTNSAYATSFTPFGDDTISRASSYAYFNRLRARRAGIVAESSLFLHGSNYTLQFATAIFGPGYITSGKYIWEVDNHGGNGTSVQYIGISAEFDQGAGEIYSQANKTILSSSYYKQFNQTSTTSTRSNEGQGTMTFLLDVDNRILRGYYDTKLIFTDTTIPNASTTPYSPFVFCTNDGNSGNNWCDAHFNFGQRPFIFTPPESYETIASSNIEPPSILNPKKHFDTIVYTGDGASVREVTGLEFQPDMVWVKSRSQSSTNHGLTDSVKTDPSYPTNHTMLYPNLTNAETGGGNYFAMTTSSGRDPFLPDGFLLNNNTSGNNNGSTYVAWCWKAGGGTSSSNPFMIDGKPYATAAAAGLNGGTANPTGASVNTKAGFSIISYTATNNQNVSYSHGLNQAPEIIIAKDRDNTRAWGVYYSVNGTNTNWMELNSSNAQGSNNSGTTPVGGFSGSYMTLHQDYFAPAYSAFANGGNDGSSKMIAYMWHSVPGYSKMGSYYGNGQTDGKFVYTGFKPAFVLLKRSTDATNYWEIRDNKRVTNNPNNERLFPNTGDSQSVGEGIDFFNNGFKLRNSGTGSNSNDKVYIYMAFADQPLTTQYGTQSNGE